MNAFAFCMVNHIKAQFNKAERLTYQITQKIAEVDTLYHRLILVVGSAGNGKTPALQKVSTLASASLINVNLELSRRMLDLTERQRALQLPRLLDEIVKNVQPEFVVVEDMWGYEMVPFPTIGI